MVKLDMVSLDSVHDEFDFFCLINTLARVNEYAWDGKGSGSESYRSFFSNGKYSDSKQLSAYDLSP